MSGFPSLPCIAYILGCFSHWWVELVSHTTYGLTLTPTPAPTSASAASLALLPALASAFALDPLPAPAPDYTFSSFS